MTASAVKRDLLDFAFCGAGGHHGDKRQAKQTSEIGLGHGSRTRRRLNNRGALVDPAVTQPIQKKRTRQTMLQAAGWMSAFIFQVELNSGKPRQGEADKMGVRRALIVGIDFADCVFDPGTIHRVYPFVILCLG